MTATIRLKNELSQLLDIAEGTKRGSILSPDLLTHWGRDKMVAMC